jgi:hypothetical protein
MKPFSLLAISLALSAELIASEAQARDRWTRGEANAWYDRQPWLVGANYVPASAINQLEMWQSESWDPVAIDREFGWAQAIGMNTMRVFLHDKLWEQDPVGFKRRMDAFLTIAKKHGIRPMFVFFDSCWDPNPKTGPQHPPIPGVHNSGWVQSPGADLLGNPSARPRLEAYVRDVVGAFAQDERILAWDVWNEPDNAAPAYAPTPDKLTKVQALLGDVFRWARAMDPVQPITSPVWSHDGDWTPSGKRTAIEAVQLDQSDVISFHNYNWPEQFEAKILQLMPYGRPILCTEYMARGNGSTFDGSLPIGKRYNVAMMNWGFVDGKTATRLPWDSWYHPYTQSQPTIWFHDVLHSDGTPYRASEAALIRRLARSPKGIVPSAQAQP